MEDVYYNRAIAKFFKGIWTPEKTVHYTRSPGNALDRQYEKFRVAPGQYQEMQSEERKFQIGLAIVISQYHLAKLEKAARGR